MVGIVNKVYYSAPSLKLYNGFLLPLFYYCSSVWHFCGTRSIEKSKPLIGAYIDKY